MIAFVRLLAFILAQLAGLGVLLLGLMMALVFWLLATESGLRMVVQTLGAVGWAQVERAEGSLFGRMSLHGVVVQTGDTTLNVECAELDWSPMALLQRQVQVNQLWLSGVRVDVADATTPKEEVSEPWAGLSLPFDVYVDDFQVDGVSLRRLGGGPVIEPTASGAVEPAASVVSEPPPILPLPSATPAGQPILEPKPVVIEEAIPAATPGVVEVDTQPLLHRLDARLSLDHDGLHLQHLQLEGLVGLADSRVNIGGHWGATPPLAKGGLVDEGAHTTTDGVGIPPLATDGTVDEIAPPTAVGAGILPFAKEEPKGGTGGILRPQDVLDFSLAWSLPLGKTTLEGQGKLSGVLDQLVLEQAITQPFVAQLSANLGALNAERPWALNLHVDPLNLTDNPMLAVFLSPEWAPRLAGVSVDVVVKGTQGGAVVERVELNQNDTRALVSGLVNWTEGLTWALDMQVEKLRPERFAPDWVGDLALSAHVDGVLQDGRPVGVLELQRVHGQLRGYPLEASLRAKIASWNLVDERVAAQQAELATGVVPRAVPNVTIEAFALRSGASTLAFKGDVGETLDVSGTLNSANLAEFLPQATGQAQANFALSGTLAVPSLQADVQGQNLGWQDRHLAELELKAEGGLQPDATLSVVLQAKGLRQGDTPVLESLSVNLSGQAGVHDLQVDVLQAAKGLRLNLQAQGAWDGTLERLNIQSAALDNTPVGSWASTQPVELVAGADQFTLPPWCGLLTTPPGAAQVCMQGQWRAGKEGASARLDLGDFDLAGLNTMLKGKPVQLRGVLAGFVTVDVPQGAPLHIHAALDGEGVVARVQTGLPNQELRGVPEWREIALDAAHAEADLGGGSGRLAANVGINDANRIEVQVNLPGLSLDGGLPPKQPMQGFVDLRFEDNALVAAFLPMLKEPGGRLAGRLLLAGTLDEPQVSGGVQLVDGHMVLPDLGVRVTEGRVLLRAYASNYLTVEGSALLGAGKATLDGRIDLVGFPKWQARLHVAGSDLSVMRLPEASVQASPDLILNLAPGMYQVSGRVDVPQALFDLGGFGAGAVRRSSDVRVLGETSVEPAGVVETDVVLTLGEDVRIQGLGFTGRVTGQVRVLDRPGQASPVAQGELQVVDGRYRAYGQDLTVEQGRLLFANSRLNDPGLDIRAVRRVTENDVVVGLHITGRATAPKIALYSQPSLPQSEMLSYLVTGRSSRTGGGASTQMMLQIAQAAGLAAASDLAESSVARDLGLDEMSFESALGTNELSFVLGKYLTPRIYLRYVQGLGNGVQTLVLTYDWTRAIQIRAQAGTQASGLDIFYRFER
ncbi:MAG: translocation/assembly module TamB domain-containing protein [Halothiobacillaceae bacterium]|nr:translocation/assembly module TamB domain-containing protein [Halothiobacillaceae bacterium]